MAISSVLGSSALLPAGLGFRNVLINGEFRINQRGYTSGSNLASGAYGFDRWKSNYTNTTLTFTSAPQGQMVTISVLGVVRQIIERANVSAGTYILSWSGTAVGRVYNEGATPPAYAASHIVASLDGLANVIVEFTPPAAGSATLWKPQLEQNRQPTPFEQRPIGVELALCQRYYQMFSSSVSSNNYYFYGYGIVNSSASFFTLRRQLLVPMRTKPTVIDQSAASGTSNKYEFDGNVTGFTYNGGGWTIDSSVTSREAVGLSLSVTGLSASAGIFGMLSGNNQNTFIAVSAEL